MTTPSYQARLFTAPAREVLDHYRVLGLPVFEANPEKIRAAVTHRLVSPFQATTECATLSGDACQSIIAARDCLLNPAAKEQYDGWLAHQLVFSSSCEWLGGPFAVSNAAAPSMEHAAEQERVFYLHEFMYFLEASLKAQHGGCVDSLLEYVAYLLLVFDRILIPAEHITITESEEAALFKWRFFDHHFTKQLVASGRIVTTIWSSCNDLPTYLEATEKYLRKVGAGRCFDDRLAKSLPGIRLFSRSPAKQSGYAKEELQKLFARSRWRGAIDKLQYEDYRVMIPLSTERLWLGDCKGLPQFLQEDVLRMYIHVMPIGNGRIYRSAIPTMEGKYPIPVPFVHEKDIINQFLLTPEKLRDLFNGALGFLRPRADHFNNMKWVDGYQAILTSFEMREFRSVIADALNYVSLQANGNLDKVKIQQSRLGDLKLVGEGIAAVIELVVGKMARAVLFLGDVFSERVARKHFFVASSVRERFNAICHLPMMPWSGKTAA